MTVTKLLYEQIVEHWEFIKYGAVVANGMQTSSYVSEYCTNLLLNLLSDKHQCWLGISDDKQHINGIAITTIVKDIGGTSRLMIDALYIYNRVKETDRKLFINTMDSFADTLGCKGIMLNTSTPAIIDIVSRYGFTEPYKVFSFDIGG